MTIDWKSAAIVGIVRRALEEDIGPGDVTTLATVPAQAKAEARILARDSLTLAGLPLVQMVFAGLDPGARVEFLAADGDAVKAGTDVVRVSGKARAVLSGERTALNFLAHLSGIASLTRKFVEQLASTETRIRDTRKTTPGLRLLEKYAVKMGGGTNHRIGLYDAILLKENHIALAGGVTSALDMAHAFASARVNSNAMTAYEAVGSAPAPATATPTQLPLTVQIEVRNERELREALAAGADSVLLDNMSPDEARACVDIVRVLRKDCIVEISGGITLENARVYAETGADFLSSGMLTHSAPAANLSLLVESIVEG